MTDDELAEAAEATVLFARVSAAHKQRIIVALNYLEEKGDLTLQVAGARQGYRLVRKPGDVRALAAKLAERFTDRERRDVDRLDAVLRLVEHRDCWTRRLATYFGDPDRPDCGHCGWCLGERPGPLPAVEHAPLGLTERALLRELLQSQGFDVLVQADIKK